MNNQIFIQYKEKGNTYIGYLIEEKEGFLYICDELCAVWLLKLNKTKWFPQTNCRILHKEFYSYERITGYHSPPEYEWVFDFEILEKDNVSFFYIAHFFERFCHMNNLALTKRTVKCIQESEMFLDKKTIKRIVTFIFDKNKNDKDRLRFITNETIYRYLKG